jgi:HJR/Mrr/RecB family endonuclease
MKQVFISYSNRDYRAAEIAKFLQAHLPTFGAKVDIFDTLPLGEDWHRSLTEAINKCSVFIGITCEMNLNVSFEIGYALGKNKEIILIGDSRSIPSDLQHLRYISRDSPLFDVLVQVQKCLSAQEDRKPYLGFDLNFPQHALDTLVQRPELLDNLEGYEFEELIRRWFLIKGYRINPREIPRDLGFDFIVESFRGKLAGVEVKKYQTTSKVPISVVRQLLGAMVMEHIPLGIVISNTPFSESALSFATESDTPILLWTLQDLIRMKDLPREGVDTYISLEVLDLCLQNIESAVMNMNIRTANARRDIYSLKNQIDGLQKEIEPQGLGKRELAEALDEKDRALIYRLEKMREKMLQAVRETTQLNASKRDVETILKELDNQDRLKKRDVWGIIADISSLAGMVLNTLL